jgi:hypothetical protein
MLVALDATHYAHLIEGYLCVNEHEAAHAPGPHADGSRKPPIHVQWIKGTGKPPRSAASARYIRRLSVAELLSDQVCPGSSRSYSFLTTA